MKTERALTRALLLTGVIGGYAGCQELPVDGIEFVARAPLPSPLADDVVAARVELGLEPGETVGSVATYQAVAHGDLVVQVMVDSPEPRAFVVDSDSRAMTTEAFWREERRLQVERFGTLTPRLYDRLATLDSGEWLTVEIMVDVDLPKPSTVFDRNDQYVPVEEYRLWLNGHVEAVQEAIASGKRELNLALAEASADIIYDLRALPYVRTNIRARDVAAISAVRGVISVDVVDQDADGGALLGDHAGGASLNRPSISGGVCGSTPCAGGGLSVGFWERNLEGGPAGIARNNYRVKNGILHGYYVPPQSCSADTDCIPGYGFDQRCMAQVAGGPKVCVQDHLTWVAASVGMRSSYTFSTIHPTGAADPVPNVPVGTNILSSGAWDTNQKVGNSGNPEGLDYLVSTLDGAVPYVNRSQSNCQESIEWPGRALYTFVSIAGGNNDAAQVSCPGFRNGLHVGSYSYNTYNAQSSFRRSAFALYNGSAFINGALDTTLERPHLLGPGSHNNVNTVGGSGLHMPRINAAVGSYDMLHKDPVVNAGQIRGTSFSSPAVLSMALLAHEYEGLFSHLVYPVVKKAVVLAASVDSNADGAIGTGTTWPQATDAQDGAGAVDGALVKSVLDNNRYVFRTLSDSDFVSCGSNCRQVQVATIAAAPSDTLRIALDWLTCTTGSMGTPLMNNDFDLAVQGSTILGSPCYGFKYSSAITSEVEMLQRSCTTSTTYKVFVRLKNGASLQNCGSSTTEDIGVAWTLRAGGGSG